MNQDLLTRRHFNDLAETWESKQSTEEKRIKEILSRVKLEEAQSILDLGCGTGVLFPHLKKFTNKKTKIFAMDFAECMTEKAFENGNSRIQVLCGDAQYLPFPENKFDFVIAFHVLPHINKQMLALEECWRVLKPGGELAIIHLRGSKELNDFHANLGGIVAVHKLPIGREMNQLLENANFKVCTIIDRSGEYFVKGRKQG